MAVIGHWLGAFPVSLILPQVSMTLLCKLSMLADTLCGLFIICRLELGSAYGWYMSAPYPATLQQIKTWKSRGEWLQGVDQEPGQNGFQGFAALWPIYVDLRYSHSVELMLYISIAIAIYMRVRYNISLGYMVAIVATTISHPIMDFFFHEGYIRMGNRAVTRVGFEFWQIPYMGPVAFVLEVAMAYGGYRLWMSTRQPLSEDLETKASIEKYAKMFWTLALTHNMISLYILSPFMVWGFSKWLPGLQAFTPAAYWSLVLFGMVVWSWVVALYPIYKIEQLTTCKKPVTAREAYCYLQAP